LTSRWYAGIFSNLSAPTQLRLTVSQIPPSGLDLSCPLDAELIHLDGSEGFELAAGGCLTCRVERGEDETVHVQGQLHATLSFECGRCLGAVSLGIEQGLDLFCLPHEDGLRSEEDEEEISNRDLVVAYYDEGQLDLAELVREQLLLDVPMKRLCHEGCKGLCPACGANRNVQSCDCREKGEDPRLLPLKGLLDRDPR
jgi:uncharacterized protein